MIRYFVAYSCTDPDTNEVGFGHAEVPLAKPIRGIRDVRQVAAAIERSGAPKVTILNWCRFEEAES